VARQMAQWGKRMNEKAFESQKSASKNLWYNNGWRFFRVLAVGAGGVNRSIGGNNKNTKWWSGNKKKKNS